MSNSGATYEPHGDGKYVEPIAADKRPKGAPVASASASRGVVYFGNGAMEIASGRVLWRLADVRPVTPHVLVEPRESGLPRS